MVDAAYYHSGIDQTYFFSGRRYARVEFTPGGSNQRITFGPAKLADHWPSLQSIGFGTVDDILPVGGSVDEAYYFSGSKFARIKLVPSSSQDTVIDGPWVITDKLKSLAGFDRIDAAMIVPGRPGEAYIFRGVNYVRVNIDQDRITYGPAKIADKWPGLVQVKFDCVDAILPVPGNTNGDTYFFYRDMYARIQVVAGAPDKVMSGPRKIADDWQSLDWA